VFESIGINFSISPPEPVKSSGLLSTWLDLQGIGITDESLSRLVIAICILLPLVAHQLLRKRFRNSEEESQPESKVTDSQVTLDSASIVGDQSEPAQEPDIFASFLATISPTKVQAQPVKAATPQQAEQPGPSQPASESRKNPMDGLMETLFTPKKNAREVSASGSVDRTAKVTTGMKTPESATSSSNGRPKADVEVTPSSATPNRTPSRNHSDHKPTPGKVWTDADFAKQMGRPSDTKEPDSFLSAIFNQSSQQKKVISSPEPGVSWVPEMGGPLPKSAPRSAPKPTTSAEYWADSRKPAGETAGPASERKGPSGPPLGGAGGSSGVRRSLQLNEADGTKATSNKDTGQSRVVLAAKAERVQASRAVMNPAPVDEGGVNEGDVGKVNGQTKSDFSSVKSAKAWVPPFLILETKTRKIASAVVALAVVIAALARRAQEQYLVDVF